MPTIAIIPVKSFRNGKLRLSAALSMKTRNGLTRAMAAHVAETAASAGLLPLVVTPDAEVSAWATGSAFPWIGDRGAGLDAAADTGVEWAAHSGSSWLVVHADLPLLQPAELAEAEGLQQQGLQPIAPSADGGTAALGWGPEARFAFGPGSFRRHLARLRDPAVIRSTGLLHDVDTPRDLASAIAHPRGAWMREHL